MLFGEILHIDDFGNIITNVSLNELERTGITEGNLFNLKLKVDMVKLKLCTAYGEVNAKQPLAIIGSHNFLEISVNQGNASKTFDIKIGDAVMIIPSKRGDQASLR